jgi:hypothetical protein
LSELRDKDTPLHAAFPGILTASFNTRFVSQSAKEAEAVVSRFFEPHVLSFESKGKIDFRFSHQSLSGTTSPSRLCYGAPVNITMPIGSPAH